MEEPREALRALLSEVPVASLAVTTADGPAVSLVPYVALRAPLRIWMLLSDLAPHTAALRTQARCAVMVNAAPRVGDARSNHALARVMLPMTARFASRAEGVAEGADAAYRERFPIAETLLGLGDFHWVALTPAGAASLVLGFGRAYHAVGPDLEDVSAVRTGA